jgi:hypothetical protein
VVECPSEMRLRLFSILQVCMGNICRSPMAERLLVCAARELVEALGKAPVLVDIWWASTSPRGRGMASRAPIGAVTRSNESTATEWGPMTFSPSATAGASIQTSASRPASGCGTATPWN